jgi:5-deoxy-glucuronate isomerase
MPAPSTLMTDYRQGFPAGFTAVTRFEDPDEPTRLSFGVLQLRAGETTTVDTAHETAWLLMQGRAELTAGNRTDIFERRSLFDESPSCLHVAAGERVAIKAGADSEFTVYASANQARFASRFYGPADVPNEHRGKGQVADACYRFVRTIFDRRNADPAAELVLGEVVTMPGRWSSYPPHHHAQPEIYHYRFTLPQGYGHAELGEQVFKVRQYDTIKILAGLDHAQCAAPGYGMYYSWVIRHLPDNPYTVPDFTAEHRWTMAPDAAFWQPKDAG